MKKHFSFEKFRIKTKKNNLNFIDVFNNDKKIHNIIRFNSHLKSKEINLPVLNQNKNKNIIKKLYISKLETKYQNNQNMKKVENKIKNDIKKNNNNNNIFVISKKKQKAIPINKINQCQNINQNFIININNNNINNSYQIKMNNNQEINQNRPEDNNFKKPINTEDSNKNSLPKNNQSELSDLSCFNSNKKTANLNSINSFVNNDKDLFSISEDRSLVNNYKINENFMKENKKIYINPVEFEKFCREVNEILQF